MPTSQWRFLVRGDCIQSQNGTWPSIIKCVPGCPSCDGQLHFEYVLNGQLDSEYVLDGQLDFEYVLASCDGQPGTFCGMEGHVPFCALDGILL